MRVRRGTTRGVEETDTVQLIVSEVRAAGDIGVGEPRPVRYVSCMRPVVGFLRL